MTPVAICGATGKMGRLLIAAIHKHPHLTLSGALASKDSRFLDVDAGLLANCGEMGISVKSEWGETLDQTSVLVDFSVAEGVVEQTCACIQKSVGMVIGTTGLNEGQQASIQEASQEIPIVLSPNMSVGVNLTMKMVELASGAMDLDTDVEIFEIHHGDKVDAPSGTAVRLGELVAKSRSVDLEDVAIHGRAGVTGQRKNGKIGFHSARGGDVVGEHTVFFLGQGERIEIGHRATDRAIFANGAVRACTFVAEKLQLNATGLYDMGDVLGLP